MTLTTDTVKPKKAAAPQTSDPAPSRQPAPPREPSPLGDFLFDLNGYLILKNAVDEDLLDRLNQEFDAFPRDLPLGHWYKGAQRRDYNPRTGLELHNCIGIGEPFEELIDHPSWLAYARRYCGIGTTFAHSLFIDECIASIRESGGDHPVHSGGYRTSMRCKYVYNHGIWQCGEVNMILALTDIGEGDGPTMGIPGSHKSNLPHPQSQEYNYVNGKPMDTIAGAVPLYMNKGDALLFVDGLMHGGSRRTNSGERRIIIYRYTLPWIRRFGYTYEPELLARLTPERRRILEPMPPIHEGDTRIPGEFPG